MTRDVATSGHQKPRTIKFHLTSRKLPSRANDFPLAQVLTPRPSAHLGEEFVDPALAEHQVMADGHFLLSDGRQLLREERHLAVDPATPEVNLTTDVMWLKYRWR